MNAVTVDGITVRSGSKEIITNLSCTVEEGEFLVIIGPNGAGKTTLLKSICGLVGIKSGTISVRGRGLEAYSRRELAATMALVPQNMNMEFSFSVEETVLMGRYPYLGILEHERKEDFATACQAMEFTGVDHLAAQKMEQLSGGERQRVMIARCICQQPKIMLLDEPTAALDPSHQLRVMKLMERLREETGTTIIMVSHDLNLAAMFAGRILLLKEGRVVAGGPPAAILEPQILHDVYGCAMHVDTHPLRGTPRISLIP